MPDRIGVVLIGAGGYGEGYVRAALDAQSRGEIEIRGIVEPFPASCAVLAEDGARGIPVYADLNDFFAHGSAQLAVISSPIHFHAPQSILAMENGCDVLCEKPVCATLQDAQAMEDGAQRTGRRLLIGYQWSQCPAIQALKRDVRAGVYGRLLHMHTIVLAPRDAKYFSRRWAGRIRDENGYILDSIAMNATAHYLQNMLFVAGEEPDRAAAVESVQACVLRANAIENYDTAAFKLTLAGGATASFLSTHAVHEALAPSFHYVFERGVVRFGPGEKLGTLTGELSDGSVRDYGVPGGNHPEKLQHSLDVLRAAREPLSTVRSTMPHLLTINAVSAFVPIQDFPQELVAVDERQITWVRGLAECFREAYAKDVMPWELEGSLITDPVTVDVRDYRAFSGVYGQ